MKVVKDAMPDFSLKILLYMWQWGFNLELDPSLPSTLGRPCGQAQLHVKKNVVLNVGPRIVLNLHQGPH